MGVSHFCVIKRGKRTTKYWHSCSKKLLLNHLIFAFLHKQNCSRWLWQVSGQSFLTNIFPNLWLKVFPTQVACGPPTFDQHKKVASKCSHKFHFRAQKLHAHMPREKMVCGSWILTRPNWLELFIAPNLDKTHKLCEHLRVTHKIVPQMCARKTGWQIQALHNLESTQKVDAIVSYWQMEVISLFWWPIFVPKSFPNTVGL